MKLKLLYLTALLSTLVAAAQAVGLDALMLKPSELPGICKRLDGVYPVGEKAASLYRYEAYRSAMPALKTKNVQSLRCGNQTGSLFYFEYGSAAEREQAELFIRPVLRADKLPQPLSVVSADTTFILISFKEPPPALLQALERKTHADAQPVAKAPEPPFTTPAPPVPIPTPSAPIAATPVAVAPKAEPPAPPVTPPTAPTPVPTPVAAAPVVPTPAAPVAVSPPGQTVVIAAGSGQGDDLPESLLGTLSDKIECSAPDKPEQSLTACEVIDKFRHGEKLGSMRVAPFVGRSHTIDSWGRFVDIHFDVLFAHPSGSISFFPIGTTNALEDYEVREIVQAKQENREVPANGVLLKIQELASSSERTAQQTAGKSATFTEKDFTFFLRRSGNSLVMVGVKGTSADQYNLSSSILAILY